MKVLVIQQKMIGDVLASTVICEALKSRFANCEVHYMIRRHTRPVVENNPYIDRIVEFEPSKKGGLAELVKFGKSLRKENYDAVIDAYGKWESIIPGFFSGAATRIGVRKWYTQLLFTKTIVPKQNIEGSAIYHRLQLAEALTGSLSTIAFPQIFLTDEEKTEGLADIRKFIPENRSAVMISILGSAENKSLPDAYMARLMDIAAHSGPVSLLVNFMPKQRVHAQRIVSLCKPETRAITVMDCYQDSLRGFLAVLAHCDALIGNEGGAVNMAKALNIPTFTVFSPWVNKESWNMLSGANHEAVHLRDFEPEVYNGRHAKEFGKQAMELYKKLDPALYAERLRDFVIRISSRI